MKIAKEYIDVAIQQYEIEVGKKENIENRAGFLMAFHGVTVAWIAEQSSKVDICRILNTDMTVLLFIKVVLAILFIVLWLVSAFFTYLALKTRAYKSYNIGAIDESCMKKKSKIYMNMWNTYNDMTECYRKNNGIKAKDLEKAFITLMAYLLCVILFVIL